MRPAAGGVHVVSTGVAEQRALQRAIYHAESDAEIDAQWSQTLEQLSQYRVAVIGAPHDAGAGFTRGSNRAPEALRRALLSAPTHCYHRADVADVGDIRVIPHLLADEMLNATQLAACRRALYDDETSTLPVSPLDLCARVLASLRAVNPSIVPVILGGDHSLGWPGFWSANTHVSDALGGRLGVLQIDAHTDLLAERLGVKFCFATWAYHANDVLGRDGRLVQLGLRASAHDREHWERTLGVRQLWAREVEGRSPESVAAQIIEHFEARGVTHLYVSHDIDGTDTAFAAATGTPEPDGLHPDLVSGVVRRLRRRFPLVGADLVEVAPPLTWGHEGEPDRTIQTALVYLDDLLCDDLGE